MSGTWVWVDSGREILIGPVRVWEGGGRGCEVGTGCLHVKGILGSGEPCALRIDWTSEGQCLPSQESHIMPEYQEHRKQENTVKIIDPVMNGCQTDTSRITEQVRIPAARKTYPEPSVACPNGSLLFSHIKLSWHKMGWGSAPSVVRAPLTEAVLSSTCAF